MRNAAIRVLLAVSLGGLLGSALAQNLVFPIGEDARFNWSDLERFDAMDLSGQTISVFGPWLGPDRDLVLSLFAYFEQATGADIDYAGSDSFEQQIVIDTQAGSPPHVAVFPQPGLAADLAARGHLVPLGDELRLDPRQLRRRPVVGGPRHLRRRVRQPRLLRLLLQGRPEEPRLVLADNFADAGYEIPGTMEELIALSDRIVADGGTPWCIGLGSGDATGWPATDWVEDILLRTQTPDVYDGWVTNEIPFNDPRIVNAIETFGSFAKNDAYVDGGAASVGATDFRDSPRGLFTVPPRCYMHRQASFIPSFFPEGTELGVDADFFYFPSFAGEDLGNPVLGAGTLWAMTRESDAARVLFDFLTTPLAHEIWMAQAGFLTPHLGVNLEAYANDTLRGQGEILQNATTFRFDGSDLMPGAIGAGAFWRGMVDFVSGASAQSVADDIQRAWEALR
jgi:alpha-glucoside transport system substrate-binding protein